MNLEVCLASHLPVPGEEGPGQCGALDRQGAVKGNPGVCQGVPKGLMQGAAHSGRPSCVTAPEARNSGEIPGAEPGHSLE